MEESVWFYFGILAVLIGFAIIAKIFFLSTATSSDVKISQAVKLLSTECENVCNSGEGTRLSVKIDVPLGSIFKTGVKTNSGKICAFLDKSQKTISSKNMYCQVCSCLMPEKTLINLSSELSRSFFKKHRDITYDCYFERLSGLFVNVSCLG